jgi:release factor glutamine methyltransferase
MISAKNTFEALKSQIVAFDANESAEIAAMVLNHFYKLSKTDIHLEKQIDETVLPSDIVDRLNKYEPIQYILGHTVFYGLDFIVNKHVLIPRPETEELVQMALKLNAKTVIDFGTGSGCIPISIKKNMPEAKVFAVEISNEALEVARLNAKKNKVEIEFVAGDILNFTAKFTDKFDLIVSNPPYVKDEEKADIEDHVKLYEPHLALFVSDTDPLVFYKKIAKIGNEILNHEGQVLVEINSALGAETAKCFEDHGYLNVQLLTDFYGKHRFVFAKRA